MEISIKSTWVKAHPNTPGNARQAISLPLRPRSRQSNGSVFTVCADRTSLAKKTSKADCAAYPNNRFDAFSRDDSAYFPVSVEHRSSDRTVENSLCKEVIP